MGKPKIFEIILDNNPECIYNPGMKISGSVHIVTEEVIQFKGNFRRKQVTDDSKDILLQMNFRLQSWK